MAVESRFQRMPTPALDSRPGELSGIRTKPERPVRAPVPITLHDTPQFTQAFAPALADKRHARGFRRRVAMKFYELNREEIADLDRHVPLQEAAETGEPHDCHDRHRRGID